MGEEEAASAALVVPRVTLFSPGKAEGVCSAVLLSSVSSRTRDGEVRGAHAQGQCLRGSCRGLVVDGGYMGEGTCAGETNRRTGPLPQQFAYSLDTHMPRQSAEFKFQLHSQFQLPTS